MPVLNRALQKMNIIYDTFCYQFADWEKDDAFCEQFEAKMKAGAYEAVFSINYAPLISTVCARHDVRYISWVYDCPIHIRDLTTLKNSCNTIYFFDRIQAEEYRSPGESMQGTCRLRWIRNCTAGFMRRVRSVRREKNTRRTLHLWENYTGRSISTICSRCPLIRGDALRASSQRAKSVWRVSDTGSCDGRTAGGIK